MEIITGYVGKPHVTSEQDRDVHIGMIGSGSYVLQTGKQMAAEISSNNEIKVRDGVLMHQGCAASIKKNTYDSLSIVNGSQGMKRIDLIVARYERNKNTGVESLTLKVLKGTPASANPATPAYTTGDIQAGDYIADMPMYKVTLDGINITKLEKQFQTVETNAALTQKVNVLNSTLATKNDLTDGGYQMHFYTIITNYGDRVEALKDSLKNRPELYSVGVNIIYVISSNDDRGMGIVVKKNATRCAFHYFDYWGTNEFWTLTSSGWEKRA